MQIQGAEHFNRLVQPWSCTAVPVHDPESRRILGVIDVTGGDEVVTPQAQLLVDATARAIEGELLVARLRGGPGPFTPSHVIESVVARRLASRPETDRVTCGCSAGTRRSSKSPAKGRRMSPNSGSVTPSCS